MTSLAPASPCQTGPGVPGSESCHRTEPGPSDLHSREMMKIGNFGVRIQRVDNNAFNYEVLWPD
jgi:hypothetical protein